MVSQQNAHETRTVTGFASSSTSNLTLPRGRRSRVLWQLAPPQPSWSVEHPDPHSSMWMSGLLRRIDVEELIGFPLPPSCRRHLPHWYGAEGSAVARAIQDAGSKATLVSLEDEEVTFRKQ